jgi:ribosomal protein S18 acetylase RimI-like enzyme
MTGVFKTHMEMSLETFQPTIIATPNQFTLRKIEKPSYETYRDLHNRIGAPYGWDKRARINDKKGMTALISAKGAEIWEFGEGATPIGYSLMTCAQDKTAEIEDFGFFPEYCGRGYGGFFLPKILTRLKTLGIKTVWLTSRSTNHAGVVPFYQKMGFRITGQTPIPDGI